METERLIELVVMARQGDADAMQTLYLDAYRSVYYLALRMVKNPEDAEDITQDVFITVQEKISELREPAAFYKWVNQITVNKCNYMLRKYKGIAKIDDDAEILALVDDNPLNLPDKAIDDAATRQIILDVIDALPDGQRVCVMLYYYQQNTISQIADMLETNENTVKTRLSLARAKIRAALEEKEKKEGIKLYGIPLALTPILRQAMEQFTVPEGVAERMWENIQAARAGGASSNGGPGADQPGSSGTSGQNVPKSGTGGGSGTSGAAGQATTGAGMTLAAKIIIGIIAAAVVTAVAIIIPRLMDSPPEPTPPAVADAPTTTPGATEPTETEQTGPTLNTQGLYEYPNGGTYEGEMVDGKRSGWGVWVYDRYRYEGYWENDRPNGEGTMYETPILPAVLSDGHDYTLEIVIQATFVNGAVDGPVTETWHMTSGKEHVFYYVLERTGATEEMSIACADCDDAVLVISEDQIRGMPPWWW